MILQFHGPPTPAGQDLRGFNGEWSLVTESRANSSANPGTAKLDR